MGKRRSSPDICLEYAFDRLFTAKLQRVYEILVPDRVRVTGEVATSRGDRHEERRDLRQSLLRPTEGGAHDRESNSGVDRLCSRTRLSRAGNGSSKTKDLAAPICSVPGSSRSAISPRKDNCRRCWCIRRIG